MIKQFLKDRLSAWYKYVSRQNLYPDDIDPLVANSWRRCLPRLNPHQKVSPNRLRRENLLAVQSANFDLISIARPVMEDIYQFVENSSSVTVLVNNAGYIIDQIGDKDVIASLEENELLPGTLIAEGQIGTNAFAIALIERVPSSVIGPDHFLQQFHDLAEAAAPIFDPAGRPLGAFGVFTYAQQYHPHTLGAVVGGARAIEGQLQSDYLLQGQIGQLAELNAVLSTISEGILVWNEDGLLLHSNEATSEIIGLPSSSLVGRQVEENITFSDLIQEALKDKTPLADVETNLAFGDKNTDCIINLHFISHPSGKKYTILSLRTAENIRQLIHHQTGVQVSVSIDDFAGISKGIQRMRYLAKTAAPARASILIKGESGTGKDYLARALHNASPRRNGPFLIFGCSSVPIELVIPELLGFEQLSAHQTAGGRPSKFELANMGTLFFQDIEVLPLEAQALLLNTLESGIIQRLQSTRLIDVDVRIMASTTADLENLVANGHFRADLYYRLSPFEISIPPLRERQTDLSLLIDRVLARLGRVHNRSLRLAPGVLELFKHYHWPGNFRELEAVLERAVIQAGSSEVIGKMHLPVFILHPANQPSQRERLTRLPSLDTVQREALLQAAKICNGNVTQMAKVLGIGRTTVWRKLKQLDISADTFRKGTQETRGVS